MEMSSMQKHRIFRIIVTIYLLCISFSYGQTINIYGLYVENRISDIETLLAKNLIKNDEWLQFTKALFEEDFEVALEKYITLYRNSTDDRLKRLILDRISQYYYAKGLYDSADRIINDEDFRKRIFSISMKKIFFGVQLGAFTNYQNAIKGKNQYSINLNNLEIITKKSGGKQLYVIVAGNFESREEAEKFQKAIREKYKYTSIIIQF